MMSSPLAVSQIAHDFRQLDASDVDWWRGGVIYQVYPRSFQDANGDGVGDLLGIVERMSYIASLGVDAIWISPFFTSPMKDFGYDVSDYCDVDPMFGTLEDFDTLIDAAHAFGVRVIIDLVLSHTSDQHLWFGESRQSRENPRSDWYVWADPKPDGTPPNNWLSIFGGTAWQWDSRREQYYLHNFLASQPDLNFHNTDVQDALLDVTRFWLERGVDGFRLDTINFYFADKDLRDNPALPPEERNATIAPSVNPYNHQRHLYSKNQPENLRFLERFRSLLDEYPGSACVGEVGDAQFGLELLGEYTSGKRAHMCYAFEFLSGERPTAARFAEVFERFNRVASEGWACWAFSNHDVQRHATRWNLDPIALRLMVTLIFCLRGSVCLYQGEELGLPEADVAFEDIQDPYGVEFWPKYKGRDGCRTPMVWKTQAQNGGFTSGSPWLPVSSDHYQMSVDNQDADSASLLNHYRKAIAFRHAHNAFQSGASGKLVATGDVLHFARSSGDETYFCAFNLSDSASKLSLPDGEWRNAGAELGSASLTGENNLNLGPWQFCLALKV